MQIPLDNKVKNIEEMPYTISYVVRKRQQIDNLMELPSEKRPTEKIIWDGTSEEMDEWLDKVIKGKQDPIVNFEINEDEIE